MLLGSSMYVNCTDPASICESDEANFLNSGGGVCDTITGRCICPEGYDGEDLWQSWNDCHVNILTKNVIEYITTGCIAVCSIASILGIARLLVLWGIVYWESPEFTTTEPIDNEEAIAPGSPRPGIVVSNESVPLSTEASPMSPPPKRRNTLQALVPSVDIAELQSPRPNARTNSFQQMVAERKRRRNTLFLIFIYGIFALLGLIFQVYRHLGYQIQDALPVMLFSLSGAMACVLWGLWILTYTWFSNLPSLRLFASMFPEIKGSLLVRYPHALRNVAIINCVVISITSWTFFFVLPMINPAYVGYPLTRVAFAVLATEIALFTFSHGMVCIILLKLFRVFNASPVSKNHNAKSKFTDGELTVKAMLILTSLAGPFFVIWSYVMAFYPFWYKYSYFFACGLLFGGSVSGIIVIYIFVFRMGSRTRVRKASTSNSPMATQSKRSFKRSPSGGDNQLGPLVE